MIDTTTDMALTTQTSDTPPLFADVLPQPRARRAKGSRKPAVPSEPELPAAPTEAVSTADASTAVPAISADSADAETEPPVLPEPRAPKAPRKAPKKGARKGKAVKGKGKATKNKSRKANSKGSAPSTGQSAPPIVIHFNELTDRERKLLRYIDGDGEGLRPMVPIKDMVSVFVGTAGTKARANSWVRNQLRDLVRGSWIVKVDRGMYQVAESARKRIRAATATDTTETAAE